jgi:hypothetical protein
MVAMVEFFFSQQAALKAIHQRKHFSIGHLLAPKKNARRK